MCALGSKALFAQGHLWKIHALLTVQTLVVILVSINRLTPLTTGYVLSNEFLRWVDLNNMLFLPLTSLIAFYLLKKHLESTGTPSPAADRWKMSLNLLFIIGVYLLGAGYGDHEVTNYLHSRFCATDQTSPLCRIIIFNDDEFSHWVFFAGFIFINVALIFWQVLYPHPASLLTKDKTFLIVNGLFIGLGIFANLAFEAIGLDLYVVAVLALVALGLLWRRGAQPLILYYATAYSFGLLATFFVKIVG